MERKVRSCANPKCRKIYDVVDDSPYCSEECTYEMTAKKVNFVTLSIHKDFKEELLKMKTRIYNKYDVSASYNDILIAAISLAKERGSPLKKMSEVIRLMKEG